MNTHTLYKFSFPFNGTFLLPKNIPCDNFNGDFITISYCAKKKKNYQYKVITRF